MALLFSILENDSPKTCCLLHCYLCTRVVFTAIMAVNLIECAVKLTSYWILILFTDLTLCFGVCQ